MNVNEKPINDLTTPMGQIILNGTATKEIMHHNSTIFMIDNRLYYKSFIDTVKCLREFVPKRNIFIGLPLILAHKYVVHIKEIDFALLLSG